MEKLNYYDRLIIDEFNQITKLVKSNDIEEIVYNDGYKNLYTLDDNEYIKADDILTKADFDNLFDEHYVKANWDDYDKYLRVTSQHGINTSYYCLSEDAKIIEGTCYKADNYIPQSYPHTEFQEAFKFVANDGQVYYIKMIYPFFCDLSDYTFELITQEEFESFGN